jgi:hypothetical protein
VWTRYLAVTESLLALSYSLVVLEVDAGYCVFAAVQDFGHTVCYMNIMSTYEYMYVFIWLVLLT